MVSWEWTCGQCKGAQYKTTSSFKGRLASYESLLLRLRTTSTHFEGRVNGHHPQAQVLVIHSLEPSLLNHLRQQQQVKRGVPASNLQAGR